MKYRKFGKTGLDISVLGLGCMRLPVIGKDRSRIEETEATKMVHLAIDEGINYIDTAYPYHTKDFSKGGASEPFLAKALKNGYRERIYLATKLPCWLVHSRNDMDRYLEEQLKRLDTGCIDFYLLHALNRPTWKKMVRYGVFGFLDDAINSGEIRYAGFSFHDDIDLFKEIVDAHDWSFCQIQYNYFDEDFQAGRSGLEYATDKGLGVIVMEPLRGGSLINDLPNAARDVLVESAGGRSRVEWALRWLWGQPQVSVILSGMSNLNQINENLALAETVSEAQWTIQDTETITKVKAMNYPGVEPRGIKTISIVLQIFSHRSSLGLQHTV